MSDEQQSETLYSLVDVSSLEGTSFLKRASMKQILLWAKIYGMEGKPTKRLDLITDVETLQYLYWNTTQQPPVGEPDTLVAQCAELSTKLPIDETSVEELTSKIPPEILKSGGDKRREEEARMGQGSTTGGTLEKGSAKNQASPEDKAAAKAAKDAEKQAAKELKAKEKIEAKASKAAAKIAAKEAKAKEPKSPKAPKADVGPRPPAEQVDAVFKASGEAGLGSAMEKAQAAFLAQPVRASGKRDSDPHAHAVSLSLRHDEASAAKPTLVSMVWFASAVTGMNTNHFYRRDAIGLIQKLGLTALHEGQPVSIQPTAEERAAAKAAKDAEKESARLAKKAEREAAKATKDAEAKAKADAIAAAAHTKETDAQIAAGV